MPVAELATFARGLKVNSYAAALFVNTFKRAAAYKMLHIHSTLRRDEWEELDALVTTAGREIMTGVMHLRQGAGTLRSVGIGTSLALYNRESHMPTATLAMNPLADGEMGRVDYGLAGTPVPFAFNDFQLDLATLMASRQYGDGLDLTQGRAAGYQVALAHETLLFNGTPAIAVADRQGTLNTVYGYTTHPARNTGTAVGDWGNTTSGYINAVNTVQAMKLRLRQDRYYGPYRLYVNDVNWTDIGSVNTQTDRRVVEVLRADPEILSVENSPRLESGAIILVDPNPQVVQWVERFTIRPVEWDEKGGLGSNYRVIGSGAPLIKSTSEQQCGVAHFTGAT